MKKLLALSLLVLLIAAAIPLLAGANAKSDPVAFIELIDVASAAEDADGPGHTRLRCSWTCADGSTGFCYPPDAETCLLEADAACGDLESD